MTTFGPPSYNWDGGVNFYAQKNAVADFYRLTSVDAGPNPPGTGVTVTSGQNSQTTGYQIAASSTWFSTVASGGAAVLPETSTPNLLTGLAGVTITILNTGANTLNVYVNPGDTSGGINGGAVTTPVAVLPGVFAILQCFQPGFWVAAGPTGGGGAVSSVFGRTGIVVANTNDYSFSQISGLLPNSQLANMPANTIKGNNTGAPAAPIDLTQAQATALLNQFTSGLQGLVSASGGGTTNFLRADNTWQQPPITINTTPVVGGTGAILYDTGGVVKEVVIGSNLTFSGGILSATGGGGGGGGTPGGSPTQLQYNASGSFGGITNLTSNGTNPFLTAIAAPASPASGFGVFYEDSTNLILSFKNAAGTVSNTVVASSAAAHQFATAVSAAGVITYTQPAIGDLANIANNTIVGNNSGGSGPPLALTAAQTNAILGTVTGSATSGQVAYWNGSTSITGDAGWTYTAPGQATLALGTITANAKALNITGTWNAIGTTFDAPLFMNITNTASAAGSILADLQLGGTSFLTLGKTPVLTLSNGSTTGTAALWVYNTVDTPQNPTNYERLVVDLGVTTTNVATIGTQNAGTGSVRNLQFVVGGTKQGDYGVTNSGAWTFAGVNFDIGTGNGGVINFDAGGGNNFIANGTNVDSQSGVVFRASGIGRIMHWDASNAVVKAAPGVPIGWSNTANDARQAADTATSRIVAGVQAFGNGTQADHSGFIQWGGQARVTSDQTFTSTTTLANVSGLSVNVAAGRTYSFVAEIEWTDAAAGGLQLAISGTATATNIIYDGYIIDSAANGIKGNTQATALGTAVASSTTTGTAGHASIYGTITVNAAGTLTVQAAQNTSNATATTIKRGSYFIVHDMP